MNAKILCIGDMVVDICASPIPRLPGPGELMLTNDIVVHPGGNALNTAVALRRLGDAVVMAGSIGADALGDLLLGQLNQLGLDTRGVRQEPNGQTASTLLFRAQDEDRRFIHTLGVGQSFTGEHVAAALLPVNGVVLVGGYLKLGSYDDGILIDLMQQARQRNCQVVLNVCIAQDSQADPRRCLRLLKHVDVFVPNEDEAQVLTSEMSLAQQARVLREAGARVVVITRGAQGLYADDGKQTIDMGAYQVEMVDPSGCGDCFTAGLVAALSRQWDLVDVLTFGSAVGALGATALGCTQGVPSFAKAQRFMKNNEIKVITKP